MPSLTLPRFYVRRVHIRDTHDYIYYVADCTTGRVVRCQDKAGAEKYAADKNERAAILNGASRLLADVGRIGGV